MSEGLLKGVRIIDSSILGPAEMGGFLADLGADVIKVEAPGGDYGRQMTWPIVEGASLLSLHTNRNKRSVILDLRTPEAVEIYLDLVRGADAVIEAMGTELQDRYTQWAVQGWAILFNYVGGVRGPGGQRSAKDRGGVGVLSSSVSTIAFFHGLRVGVYVGGAGVGVYVGGAGVGVCVCVGVGVGVSFANL